MSVLDELQFTDKDLCLAGFVDRFGSEFPVILITRIGIDPADDPLHCISAEEVYWINGIEKQTRIVATDIKDDKHRRYFSIPLDYHRKFQLVETGGHREILGPPMTMQKIVERMNLTSGPTKFVFADNSNVQVNYEGSKSRCQQIGTLKIIEKYEQKYLVGHTLYNNVMDMMPRSIPIYLEITVDVATGFNGRNNATFKEWMRSVKELGRCNQSTTAKTCGAIIQFRELPESGLYEYIQPYNYLKTQDITRHQEADTTHTSSPSNVSGIRRSNSSGERTREGDADISTTPPAIPGRTYGTKRLPPIPPHTTNSQTIGRGPRPPEPTPVDEEEAIYGEYQSVPAFRHGREEIGAYEIAPYAESRSPTSDLQESLTTRKTKRKPSAISQFDTNPYAECTPEPLYEVIPYAKSRPIILPKSHLRKDSNTTAVGTSATSDKLVAGIYGEALSVGTSWISETLPTTCCIKNGLDTNCSPSTPTYDLLQFKHISEIPADIDLSSLSVVDFAHCLRLLGLSKHSDVFRENDVDGKLASEFSSQTLVGSFNFSDFEAVKFMRFMEGWRPNVK